ncbi:Os06g0160700, partial [Oryza sativa Japonica Group]
KNAVGIADGNFDIQGTQVLLGGSNEARHVKRLYMGPCRLTV